MEIKRVEIEGERVFLKKGLLGWSIVYPVKNINGTWNWKNIISGGNWLKLIILGVIVLLILGSIYEYSQAVSIAQECLDLNPILKLQ